MSDSGALQYVEKISNDGDRRRITLDSGTLHKLTVNAREVESTIPAGFQQIWIEGEDAEGNEFMLTSGAGWGSVWATFVYKGREFVIDGRDLIRALIELTE